MPDRKSQTTRSTRKSQSAAGARKRSRQPQPASTKLDPPAMPKLRLAIELIPRPLWGKNLRTALGKHRWYRIRDDVAPENKKDGCEICGCRPPQPLLGHEAWEYEENRRTGIARLKGIKRICQDCSSIHHFGRTAKLAQSGVITPMEFERIIQHFLKVNKCTAEVFGSHFRDAQKVWHRRSNMKWIVDFGSFS